MQKSLAEKIADAKARKEAATVRLTALEAKAKVLDRKRDTRRKIIVGSAVLAHAQLDAEFALTLQLVLDQAVTRDKDRAEIADLLK